jgi:predicted SnoaL-like aldol condensation-catalyzing enzyme
MSAESRRQARACVAFLKAVVAGRDPHAAGARLFAPKARHHNPHFAAGMPALLAAMGEDEHAHPGKRIAPVNVVADDRRVAVHSRLSMPGKGEMSVCHLFRFSRGQVVEFWDLGMPVPKRPKNRDGAF